MRRLSLVLFSILALMPILQVQQAYAMYPGRVKKEDSFARSAVLPWIRAIKVPISVIGTVTCGVIGGLATASLSGAQMPSTGGSGLPVSASGILYGLGLGYVGSALFSTIMHKETPYQQTQSLQERTSETVQDATVKPLKSAIKIPAAMIIVGIPVAALVALIAGKDALLSRISVENASNAIQVLVAIFGFAGAMEYLRQLTDFASNKPQ